jgi:cobalamin biosynthesis Mg chelatase CobN
MIRTPYPNVRGLRLPSAALFSVLALLAFASFPVVAQANPNYELEETELPKAEGEKTPAHHHKNPGNSESSPEAEQSVGAGGGGGHNGGGGGQSPSESSNSPNEPSQESKSGTSGGETHAKSGNGAPKGQKATPSVQIGENKSAVGDSGGSSPLVPILIAVAVLAAISVGAVLVRQRRGSASGLSPKRG